MAHILVSSVHGFAITSYLHAAPASEAAIRQVRAVQLGLRGASWCGRIDQHQSRVAGACTEFVARQFMSRCSERDDSAAWNNLA